MTKQLSFNIFKTLGLVFLILIGLFVYFNSDEPEMSYKTKAYSSSQDLRLFKSRTLAPDLNWQEAGNKSVRIEQLKGKIVYFNFWAEWCPPCVQEMDTLDNLFKELRSAGLQMYFINLDSDSEGLSKAKTYYKESKFLAPAIFSQNEAFSSKIQVQMLPYHLVIDRDGRVAAEFFGDIASQGNELKVMLQQLLTETPASASKK